MPVVYTISGSGTWDATFQFSTDGGATWSGAQPALHVAQAAFRGKLHVPLGHDR